MSMRFLLAILLALLVGVIACSREDALPEGAVVITLPMSGGARAEKMYAEMIPAFEKANPGIKVKRFDIPSQAYYTKLLVMIAAGSAPDLAPMMTMRLPTYLERNAFLPLDDLMAEDADFQARKDDIYAKSLEGFYKDGKLYAVTYAQNLYALHYNKTLFDQYNQTCRPEERIEYPTGDWDLEHYVEVAKKLTRDTDGDGRIDQWGIMNENTPFYVICPILRKFGTDLFNADKTRCLLDEPQAIAAMKWYFDLALVDRVAPSPVGPDARAAGTVVGGPEERFMAGKIAMWETASEYRFEFNSKIKHFEWDVAEPPHGVRRDTGYECFALSITRSSQHPKEAWKFISFMVSPEGQKILLKHNMGIPVLKSLCNSREYFLDDTPPAHKAVYLKTLEYGQDIPSLKNFQEVENSISAELAWGLLGKKSAEDACRAAAKEANRLLAENRPSPR